MKLAQIFTEAGLPPGVFNIVLGLGQSAGKMLAEHPDINKLVLTGGTEAGRIAGASAAKVFAHQTMELGGKTPVMVFDDFDVDQRRQLRGVRRLHRRRPDLRLRLAPYRAGLDLRRIRREAARPKRKRIRIGDPFDPATQLGPVISARQRDRVLTYSRLRP